VELAGVGHGEDDLRVAGNRRERFERLHWQRRNPKNDDAAGQGVARRVLRQMREKTAMNLGAAGVTQLLRNIVEHGAPQRGLPEFIGLERDGVARGLAQDIAASGPVFEPVGAINLVLVEKIGDFFGKLVAAARIAVRQKMRERREFGLLD